MNTVVNTNILALNSHRNLGKVSTKQSISSQRLSSGFRVNSAADDAAGLGISQKKRAQIRGLDQASRNAQDGISLIQTAEGALSTIGDILIRVRELTIQASSDTSVGGTDAQSDRVRIQDEIDQLMTEIDAIARRTEFNTRTLLSGSLHPDGVIRGGEWRTVDQKRTNAPALIRTLDQFLHMTSNQPFAGSFADLLIEIGANLEGTDANEWIAVHAASNFSGLEQALDAAMAGRWEQLQMSSGLNFENARAVLDAFVQGLHNPNALRSAGGFMPGGPQQAFSSWDDFLANANPQIGASTFAKAMSQTGGEALYQALIRAGFNGLNENSTFSDVRRIFYTLGGGWGDGLTDDIVAALSFEEPGRERSWLELRVNSFGAAPFAPSMIPGVSQPSWWNARFTQFALSSHLSPQPADGLGIHTNLEHMWTRNLSGLQQHMDGFASGLGFLDFTDWLQNRGPAAGVGGASFYDFGGAAGGFRTAIEYIFAVAVNATATLTDPFGSPHWVFNVAARPGYAGPHAGEFLAFWRALDAYILTIEHDQGTPSNQGCGPGGAFLQYWSRHVGRGDRQWIDIEGPLPPLPPPPPPRPPGNADLWETFRRRYLTADSEIIQRDVWIPDERERKRGVSLWFQTGANSGQGVKVEIGSMSTGTLFGREGANHTQERRIVNVLDVFGYNVQDGIVGGSNFGNGVDGKVIAGKRVRTLLEALDGALAIATRQRSYLGAIQNRLEFTIENVDIASENLNAATSRIRDADMAREMMRLTQVDVLQQAASAMLAQGNQAPQSVLQLLG